MLMNLNVLNGKTIIVTQIKSSDDQKKTLIGLGLNGIGSTSELVCTKPIFGMIAKVKHLVDIKIK